MASIYFKYGAMNAGKSTALIQAAHNYKERGMNTLIYKSSRDTRDIEGQICSRVGLSVPCILIHPEESLLESICCNLSDDIKAVLIDEAQFLSPRQVDELVIVAKRYNIPVLCYGLKNDFSMTLFEASARLLVVAEKLEELKTVCWCGSKATQNARVDSDGNVIRVGDSIVVGDTDMYVPLCLEHCALGMSQSAIERTTDAWLEYARRIGQFHYGKAKTVSNDLQEDC